MDTEDLFKKAFDQLEKGEMLVKIWDRSIDTLETMLNKIGLKLDLDLSEGLSWFDDFNCEYDSEDVLSQDMTIQQFRRRLGNYLLYQSATLQNKKDVARYIRLSRKPPSKKISSAKTIHLNIVKQKRSWISLFFNSHSSAIMESFNAFSGGLKEIGREKARHFFRHLLGVLRLNVPEDDIKEYLSTLKESLTLRQIIQSTENWANSHPQMVKSYANRLEQTCHEYKDFENRYQKFIDIKGFNRRLNAFAEKYRNRATNELSKGTEEVFYFYSKSISNYSSRPSFDDIESNNTTLTLPKYMLSLIHI